MSTVPAEGALAAQAYQNKGSMPHSNNSSSPSAVVHRSPVNPEGQAVSALPSSSEQPSAANATSLQPDEALKAAGRPQQQGTSAQQPHVPRCTTPAATAACTELAVEAAATGPPHHATVESLGLSTTAATASSSTETASSGTHTPSSPPAAKPCQAPGATATQAPSSAADDNRTATASSDYVSATPQPPLVLTSALHAFDCECGELSLRNDEVQLLQPFLLQRCWRLVPCPVPARKGSSKGSRSRVRPSRRITQELEALQSACDSTAFELGRKRQKRASTRYDDLGDDRKSSRIRGGSPGNDPSVASVKSADASVVSQTRTRSRAGRNCATQPDTSAGYGGVEPRSSRRRRYMNGDDTQSLNSDAWGDGEAASSTIGGAGKPRRILASTRWRDSCMAILQHLKSLKAAQWFLYPVDPEADNVPDYFDVVQHPMDLQTVEKKLLQGAYHHPFLWQQDVRQVFFNAFSYHVMSNDVWKDATALALEFERCCKQVDEVNPYAEVVSDSDELAASLQTTRPLESLQLTAPAQGSIVEEVWPQHQQIAEPAVKDRRAPTLPTMDTTCAPSLHPQYQEEQQSFYHAGSMGGGGRTRSRTRRTQRQPVDTDDGGYEEYSLGRSSSRKMPPANSSPRRGGRGRGRGCRGPGMQGRQGAWDGLGGPSSQAGYGGGVESIQSFEPPADGVVLPPPPVPRIGVNDKPLSSSQRRTLEHHMTMLSPEQRRAALELIQDDLGILAADHMCDSTFSFDTELLSIEKQKRLFAYVNSMVRANRELLMSRGLLGNPAADAQAASHSQKAGEGVPADGRRRPRDGAAAGRHDSDSSSSDSDSDSSSSSDSLSSSTSSSDSDSDDGDRPCPPGNTQHPTAGSMPPGNPTGGGGGGFDGGGCPGAPAGNGGTTVQKGLPEYRPVAEDGEKVQIREELMGRHADFLGVIDAQQADDSMTSAPQEAKSTAWQEWKGQVIQQGFAAERAVAPQRSASEIIAEGYDARI